MTVTPKDKIIIVSPGDSFFKEPHAKALTELGFECSFFNHRSGVVYTNRYVRRFLHLFPAAKIVKRLTISKINSELIKMVADTNPKYILVLKGENITPETIHRIRDM